MAGGTPKAKTTSNFQEDGERQGWRQIGRMAPDRLEGAGQPQEHQTAKIVTHGRRATWIEPSDQSVSLERPVTRRQPRSHERPRSHGNQEGAEWPEWRRAARMAPSGQESAEWPGERRSAMGMPNHQEDD